ncbi:MAG: ATP-dependent DNA helicase, partial [Aquincola sp.]|nr:ATP-dependent DNA helicase [Aquincola sp.]
MSPTDAAPDAAAAPYPIAVRAMCEFTAKEGDLDLRFTPSPTAQEGIEGHATVAARRGAGWQAELSLSAELGGLLLRGRADGFDAARGRLEEVKTYRGEFDAIPANHRALHWAQLKVYGALLCRQQGLAQIELALVYFHVDKQTET